MICARVTDPNFIEVLGALNESGIPYFIGGGTLLRLYRDGDFAPDSGDVDICFREGTVDRRLLEDLLRRLRFDIEFSDEQNMQGIRDGGRKIDFNFYSSLLRMDANGCLALHDVITWTVIPHTGLQETFYFKWNRITRIINGNNPPENKTKRLVSRICTPALRPFENKILAVNHLLEKRLGRLVEYRIPSHLLDNTHLVVAPNVSWYQPVQVEAVLEEIYGPNWQTPTRREEWFGYAKESPT